MNRVKRKNPCLKIAMTALAVMCIMCGVTGTSNNPYIQHSIVAYAVDGIPDNQSYDDSNAEVQDSDKIKKPDANDVFGGAEITPDSTGYSDGIGNILQKVTSFIVAVCNYLFIFGLIAHFAIESVMMAFPVVATVMSTKVPWQLYSHECAKVCGVTHSYRAGGNGPGGGPGGAAQPPAGGPGGGKDEKGFLGKFTTYFKERMITLVLAGIILVLCSTGLMPKLINMCINWIIGLFIK